MNKTQNNDRPLIEPLTNEQRNKEQIISKQIQEAESDAIVELLSNTLTLKPNDLVNLVENAYSFAEAMTNKYRDPATPIVACKNACYWCCFQNVLISAPEGFRISAFLRKHLDENAQTRIKNQLYSLNRRIKNSTSIYRSKLHLPCAFLHQDECSIYSVRPLMCAEFTSFNIQDCKRGYNIGFKDGSIIHEKARLIVFKAVQNGFFDGLKKVFPKADNIPLELTTAVCSIIDKSIDEIEWVNGSITFTDAHLNMDNNTM